MTLPLFAASSRAEGAKAPLGLVASPGIVDARTDAFGEGWGRWASTATSPLPMRLCSSSTGFASQHLVHARTYVPMLGRFTRPDPNTRFSLFNPQSLNRYAYVVNNPVKFVDPTGMTFVLAGCGSGSTQTQCQYQQSLVQSALPEQARQYVKLGAGGRLVLQGMKASEFAKQFGAVARGLSYLLNSADTYTLKTGVSVITDLGGGAAYRPGSRTIHVNPANFPKPLGGVEVSATEAFVHELGHAVSRVIPGAAGAIDRAAQPKGGWFQVRLPLREGFAMAFENTYRRETLGTDAIRSYYSKDGDYVDVGSAFSWLPE